MAHKQLRAAPFWLPKLDFGVSVSTPGLRAIMRMRWQNQYVASTQSNRYTGLRTQAPENGTTLLNLSASPESLATFSLTQCACKPRYEIVTVPEHLVYAKYVTIKGESLWTEDTVGNIVISINSD